MKIKPVIFSAAILFAACGQASDPVDKKVDELLSKMTLEEKIGQLNLVSRFDFQRMSNMVAEGKVGSIININTAEEVNRIQKVAVEESRLGIPILIGRDVIHGFHTIFPIPLGQAATFNPQIVELGARIAAIEATSAGIRWTFSPMVDIARDPRWGRIAEGSGEDTYLNSVMGAAMVRGYQGDDLTAPTSMAACVKHFAGYGAAEGGRDYNSTKIPPREMHNIYLPPFKAAIDAGAVSIMTAFNDNDGVPATGDAWLLGDLLRNEWGFDGMVVTDWNSSGEMISHGVATDNAHATQLSINSGVDMDMMSFGFLNHLKELVESGKVSKKTIDNAVRNVLRLKFQLGLFDNPYTDKTRYAAVNYAPEHLEAAKECATESVILLKNDNQTLPLTKGVRILVTGPMADAPHDQMGTWVFDGQKEHTVTPLVALQATEGVSVRYIPGLAFSRDKSTAQLAQVTSAARQADVVVVFVGEEAILSGEAHSLSNLDLQGAQSTLIAAAKASGKPVVTVVMAGRPLTIERDLPNCDALLYMFHPGTMGGPAIADLLTGKAVPSGKTPVTFLRTVGQVPMYYNHNNTGRPALGNEILIDGIELEAGQTSLGCTSFYMDSGWKPLFPFGYGLSYTTFEYSDVKCDKDVYGMQDTIEVEFTLRNSGKYDGVEVAQLYIRDLVASIARPVRELKRFERVSLRAGEERTVNLSLPVSELAFYGLDNTFKVEPGEFRLWVAGDSVSGEPITFEVK